jgi:protein TonB
MVDAVSPPPPPPPTPPQPTLVRAGGQVREPKKIVDVAPIYPDIARNNRVEGLVILEAVINEAGAVERIKILRSHALLDSAAIEAVKRWRYTPTLLNGTPVSVLMTITVNFKLN